MKVKNKNMKENIQTGKKTEKEKNIFLRVIPITNYYLKENIIIIID